MGIEIWTGWRARGGSRGRHRYFNFGGIKEPEDGVVKNRSAVSSPPKASKLTYAEGLLAPRPALADWRTVLVLVDTC